MSNSLNRPERPKHWGILVTLTALAVLFLISAWGIAPNWERLAQAPEYMVRYTVLMFGGVFQNPFDAEVAGVWFEAIQQMLISVAMAWLGTMIAAIFSLPLAFLAASNVAPSWVTWPLRQIMSILRSIPDVLIAVVIFLPLYGLGPLAGAFALGVGSIGSLGKLTAEVVEGMPKGTIEAVRATGARPVQVVRWGVFPQVFPEIVAFWLYRFEINIRAGAILGAVGAGGIGAWLGERFQGRYWEEIGIGLLVVIVITVTVDSISARIRHRIIAGPAGTDVKSKKLSQAQLRGAVAR